MQELMIEAEKTPNVVKVCNRKGLYDQLDDLQKRYKVQYIRTYIM